MAEESHGLARDLVVGIGAAVRSPRRIELDLQALLAWPEIDASQPLTEASVERAIRIAYRALRLLSQIPGGYWRNTCLYRSVAECEIRREYGGVARIVIGVDKAGDDVVAHSWVEQLGSHDHDSRAMRPLHSAQPSAVVG